MGLDATLLLTMVKFMAQWWPSKRKPQVPVSEAWIDYQDPRVKSEEADLR